MHQGRNLHRKQTASGESPKRGPNILRRNALLEDDNRLFIKHNNEAKHRRSTKATVLGKAKVMSYEHLEEARARRAKKVAKASRGNRGRKRKSSSGEGTVAGSGKAKRIRKSELEAAKGEIVAAGLEDYCSILQL